MNLNYQCLCLYHITGEVWIDRYYIPAFSFRALSSTSSDAGPCHMMYYWHTFLRTCRRSEHVKCKTSLARVPASTRASLISMESTLELDSRRSYLCHVRPYVDCSATTHPPSEVVVGRRCASPSSCRTAPQDVMILRGQPDRNGYNGCYIRGYAIKSARISVHARDARARFSRRRTKRGFCVLLDVVYWKVRRYMAVG